MEKNFLGLDGLKHFWTKAKTWIMGQITAEVTAKIAEVVANAPEDLDTLKEIADWIKNHANDAAAMNTEILANKTAISGKADKSHTHTKSEITDFTHTHDDRYYTEREVDAKLSGKADKSHTHTKSEITDFPTSLPANGGTASSCSGNSATATQLQTARTINIQDSSATYTGTGASFNGSGDATIKLPSIIKANEFKIGNGQQSIEYRSKSFNGYKMHEVQTNALYIEGRESDTGDSGGLAITNDSVTVFGAGDTNGVFRVVNEDDARNGSAPTIFNIFKDGKVTMTNRLTAPSATIGSRPVITGSYSNGVLNLYTN